MAGGGGKHLFKKMANDVFHSNLSILLINHLMETGLS